MELRRSLSPFALVASVLAASPLPAQSPAPGPARARLDLAPFTEIHGRRGPELELLLADERILVCSGLQLFALKASSLEPVWSTARPAGWEALDAYETRCAWNNVDREGLFVTSATGHGVVVATLHTPLVRAEPRNWQGIPIYEPPPERRLFAFELARGSALWNHAPPPDWDGASGPFEQRMSVVNAPLVLGDRVLVGCTQDRSSIDYHVACYELGTGRRRWTAFVQRGQVARSTYGVPAHEFAAAPLVASSDGRLVIVQTELGRIVALDPDTGEVRWEHAYERIPLPKSTGYSPAVHETRWRTSPPLVTGELLLATARDSKAVLVLDVATGREHGSLSAEWLDRMEGAMVAAAFAPEYVVGVRGDTLFLAGTRLAAVQCQGGIGSGGDWRVSWWQPIGQSPARVRLMGERLFAPGRDGGVVELDARDGHQLQTWALRDCASLLATECATFVLDWDSLQRFER